MNETSASEQNGITVYWRPGCGFCSTLLRQLDHLAVPYALVNIWQEPDGAAFVRSVARGNETVPTVA
ncbi:MAG TPA: glutaredoxin domain-containing protein, partial [Ilumatobacteraceae bacterium]